MMGCWVLYNETLIALNALENRGHFDGPFANECPFFIGLSIFFLCVGGLPPCLPIVCELF